MNRAILGSIAFFAVAGSAMAQSIGATAVMTFTQNGSNFNYDIDLSNIGTSTIGTLWFSWVPGQDFMLNNPSTVVAPTGWAGIVTHAGAGDGYAVQYVANTAATRLAAGNSLDGFKFTTTETPAELLGNSPFFPLKPEGTTFVYDGAPFSNLSEQFVIHPVPEPATLAALGFGVVLLRRRRRKSA